MHGASSACVLRRPQAYALPKAYPRHTDFQVTVHAAVPVQASSALASARNHGTIGSTSHRIRCTCTSHLSRTRCMLRLYVPTYEHGLAVFGPPKSVNVKTGKMQVRATRRAPLTAALAIACTARAHACMNRTQIHTLQHYSRTSDLPSPTMRHFTKGAQQAFQTLPTLTTHSPPHTAPYQRRTRKPDDEPFHNTQ